MSLNAIDVHVGGRLRARRQAMALRPAVLAGSLGLSEAQLISREAGHERISATEMFKLVRILNVKVSYFFADLPVEP